MEYEKLEQQLNETFKAIYDGLKDLATEYRNGANPDDLAKAVDEIANGFCKRWPICEEKKWEEQWKEQWEKPRAANV